MCILRDVSLLFLRQPSKGPVGRPEDGGMTELAKGEHIPCGFPAAASVYNDPCRSSSFPLGKDGCGSSTNCTSLCHVTDAPEPLPFFWLLPESLSPAAPLPKASLRMASEIGSTDSGLSTGLPDLEL